MWICQRCQASVEDSSTVCRKCGTPQDGDVAASIGRSTPSPQQQGSPDNPAASLAPSASGPKSCPKCSGAMIQGWVTDHSRGGITMGKWHAGQPRESFWFGTKANLRSGLPLGAFRCEACGFVEFYADAAYEAT